MNIRQRFAPPPRRSGILTPTGDAGADVVITAAWLPAAVGAVLIAIGSMADRHDIAVAGLAAIGGAGPLAGCLAIVVRLARGSWEPRTDG